MDIVTLFKVGELPRRIHAVDVDSWLSHGWSREPIAPGLGVELPPDVVVPVAPPVVLQPVAEPVLEPVLEPVPVAEVEPVAEKPVVPTRRKRSAD